MINLNAAENAGLIRKCGKLSEYMEFVRLVRDFVKKGLTVQDAVDNAVDECIKEGILRDILLKNKAEVKSMVLEEFDVDAYEAGLREEGRREGIREGIREGRREGRSEGMLEGTAKAFWKLVKSGMLSAAQACAQSELSEEDFYRFKPADL